MLKKLTILALVALFAISAGGCKAVVKLLSKGGDEAVEAAAHHSDDLAKAGGRGVGGVEEGAEAARAAHVVEEEGNTAVELTVEAASTAAELAAEGEEAEGSVVERQSGKAVER